VNGEPMDIADIDEDVHCDLMSAEEYEEYFKLASELES
jgi:hypothetical protein